jgi:predicted DsbA family dithiol-disulfide isomerase
VSALSGERPATLSAFIPQETFMSLVIDVISDVVCPWCYIGKRNLEAALVLYREKHPEASAPTVRWHPFQLNPQLPKTGVPRAEYLEKKFGGPARAQQIYARVTDAGKKAGIDFQFDRIVVQPNTVDAHRLVYHALEKGKQDAVVEELFKAYFLDARDLTKTSILSEIAEKAGIDRKSVAEYLETDEDSDLIAEADHEARQVGVEGVPFFILNRKVGLSGAQPPEMLLQAMEEAAAEQTESA